MPQKLTSVYQESISI